MSKVSKKLRNGILRVRKFVHQRAGSPREVPKQLLFVFGCQRSGTSMFTQMFSGDLNTKIYGEKGFGNGKSHRIRPVNELAEIFDRHPATLQVSKNLVESQRARELLDRLPFSKAVWMVRDFRDVARSNQKRFGDKIALKNLKAIAEPGAEQTFAGENITEETKQIVRECIDDCVLSHDLHCLFWYVRNILFFDQRLQEHDRVLLVKYEDILRSPVAAMRSIYRFMGLDFPGEYLVRNVRRGRHESSAELLASPKVLSLCRELQSRLESRMISPISEVR